MKQLLAVLSNRNLLLLSAGRIISRGGDYIFRVALSVAVYDFSGGNSFDVGLLWVAILVPTMALGPISGRLADRLGYRRAMITSDLARMVTVAVMALLLNSTTWEAVFPLTLIDSAFSTIFGPANTGLIPSLVESKDQRLAANSVVLQAESIALIIGSALGGIGAGAGLIVPIFLIDSATFGASALSLLFIHPRSRSGEVPEDAEEAEPEPAETGNAFLAGFRLILARPVLVFALTVMALPEFESGSTVVWFVPFSIHNLHLGGPGVGYTYAALGIGSVVGGVITAAIGGNVRLDYLVAGSVAVGGLFLIIYGASTIGLIGLSCAVVLGIVETTEYAAYGTLLQQVVPENQLGAASGTMDAVFEAMMLIGSLISGPLAQTIGVSASLIALGVLEMVGPTLAVLKLMRDTVGQPKAADLARIPAFATVPQDVREWAVRRMLRERFPPGAIVIRQGDQGDKFYTIAQGTAQVEVAAEGEHMTVDLQRGDFFGEIALIRDVPRTATVRALRPLTVYALSREDFQELQNRASTFKESLQETAAARLAEDVRFQVALGAMRS